MSLAFTVPPFYCASERSKHGFVSSFEETSAATAIRERNSTGRPLGAFSSTSQAFQARLKHFGHDQRSFRGNSIQTHSRSFFGVAIAPRCIRRSNVCAARVYLVVCTSEIATLLGKDKLKVLLVGSGGREHALAKSISESPFCRELLCAPGNAGIALDGIDCLMDLSATDVKRIVRFAKDNSVDFVIVGPEAPLVLGLVDELESVGIPAFGPRLNAAVLEGSKAFMKDFCKRHNISTAAYGRFTTFSAAANFIEQQVAPIVVKADGLAAGKGVIIANSVKEALEAANDMLNQKRFGSAGSEIVVEAFLKGEEASFFALVDGSMAIPLASAQDHKRVGEGDTGPNTGGMGAYSPAPVVTPAIERAVMDDIILPTVRGMASEGRPFKGVLFAGLMIDNGIPTLLEYNVRFGDPECQTLCMRLKSDLLTVLVQSAVGSLEGVQLRWSPQAAMCVVMAANGYPGDYVKGTPIRNILDAASVPNVNVYHAGTDFAPGASLPNPEVIATGGRVLGVTAVGDDIAAAQQQAYRAVDLIDWPEGFCRRDIGWRAIPTAATGRR